MIIIFIGPPYAGKGTQVNLLAEKLGLPFFAMGELIRSARSSGDPKAIKGFEEYSMKGLHLPIDLKFYLLKDKLDKASDGFILDNFPANKEDLEAFNNYLRERRLTVDKVVYLFVSEEEMKKRMIVRGRADDSPDILMIRREIQDKDRVAVIEHFKRQGVLEEINGKASIEEVHQEILNRLGKSS